MQQRFALQSKLRMSKHNSGKEKMENLMFMQTLRSHFPHWPTNWKAILKPNVKTFFEEVRKHLVNCDDFTSDDADSEAMKGIVNNFYLTKICRAMEKEIKANPLCPVWLKDVFPRSKGPSQSLDICELLQVALLFSSFTYFSKFV